MTTADSVALVDKTDPALVYLLFTWLRKRYVDHVNADAVLGRLLEVSKRGSVASKMKEGQGDPVVEWFEDGYSYRELAAPEFVALVVDKLES